MIALVLVLVGLMIMPAMSLLLPLSPKTVPFSGFKIECLIPLTNMDNSQYHLLYYLDNKLVWDKPLGSKSIPWGQKVLLDKESGSKGLIFARRKPYALRKNPVYLPNMLIGAIYNAETNHTMSPLISENFLTKYWVQLSISSGAILHLPILSTPSIDLTRFNFDHLVDWDKYIKIDEDYKFAYVSKYSVRRSIDEFISHLNGLSWAKGLAKLNSKLPGDFILMRLFLIGKYSSKSFDSLLRKYDSLMQYS